MKWRLAIVVLISVVVVGAVGGALILKHRGTHLIRTIRINHGVTVAAISRDGRLIATADMSNPTIGTSPIYISSATDGSVISSTASVSVYNLTFSPDGNLIAAVGNDGLRLIRTNDGKLLRTITATQVFCAAFSPDGQLLAFAGAEGRVKLLDTQDGAEARTFDAGKWITSVAFSPDGQLLAVGTAANTGLVRRDELSQDENPVLLFRIFATVAPTKLPGHQYGVLSLAFRPDGKLLASGGSDGLIRLSDVNAGNAVGMIATNDNSANAGPIAVRNVGFDPTNKTLYAALDNGTVLLLEGNTGARKGSWPAHHGAVLGGLFLPTSSQFLSVGKDRLIKLWQLASGST